MQDKSRGAPTKAPTAKDPDSTKDLPIISAAQTINQPEPCGDTLPAAQGAEEVPA